MQVWLSVLLVCAAVVLLDLCVPVQGRCAPTTPKRWLPISIARDYAYIYMLGYRGTSDAIE